MDEDIIEADPITDPGPIPEVFNPSGPPPPTVVTSPDGSEWVLVDGHWVPRP